MTRDLVIDTLRRNLPGRRRFHVRSLALFGSVARDEAGPDSDVDVLVDFEVAPTLDDHGRPLSVVVDGDVNLGVDLLAQRFAKRTIPSPAKRERAPHSRGG